MDVKVIPAKPEKDNDRKDDSEKKLTRVAAYCRVSTELEEQESSYQAQVSYYTGYILSHPDWALAGIYADEGISGTDTKKREEFNRMIKDCQAGKIDMIITKSISRFARNTLDCLKYIRLLKDRGIGITFEKENINTLDAKGEVLITIMASLAQQESESISQNVTMGIRYLFRQGKVRVNHSRFLGYTKDDDGNLIIDPEQAEIVRMIYEGFLSGKSTGRIGEELENAGIVTGAKGKKWYTSTIKGILTNEKYMGDALLQKVYTADCLTHKKVPNNGAYPQYYIKNNHEAIIPREMFQAVQREIQKRADKVSDPGIRQKHSSMYPFSNKLICANCGATYRRVKGYDPTRKTAWYCKTRVRRSALCNGRIVKELAMKEIVLDAIKEIASDYEPLKQRYQQLYTGPMHQYDEEIERLESRILDLKEYIVEKNRQEDISIQAIELNDLEARRRAIAEEKAKAAAEADILKFALDFMDYYSQDGVFVPPEEYDEDRIRPILENITVYDESYKIRFTYGRVITIPYNK